MRRISTCDSLAVVHLHIHDDKGGGGLKSERNHAFQGVRLGGWVGQFGWVADRGLPPNDCTTDQVDRFIPWSSESSGTVFGCA